MVVRHELAIELGAESVIFREATAQELPVDKGKALSQAPRPQVVGD